MSFFGLPTVSQPFLKLCKGYLRLVRIAVLCHKIAGIVHGHDVINLTMSTFTRNYHLIDVNKMIFYVVPNVVTCFFCLIYNLRKVLPRAVSK